MPRRKHVAWIMVLATMLIMTGMYYYWQQSNPSERNYAGFWITESRSQSPEKWVSLTKQVASGISRATPAEILIVGRIVFSPPGTCTLSFPSNQTYSHMFFNTQDQNEDYLTTFDDNGIKVWLEVEPGFADIDQLIDLVLGHYKHHTCVQGIAIDLEWHWGGSQTHETVPVTDEEATRWLNRTQSHNSDYTLFLIHWVTDVMPPTIRQDIVFIDDQQSFEGLDSLVQEFKTWGENFSETDVGYIFGYTRDLEWLSKLEDPPRDIGSAVIQNIPNCHYVFWSQETIPQMFPPS